MAIFLSTDLASSSHYQIALQEPTQVLQSVRAVLDYLDSNLDEQVVAVTAEVEIEAAIELAKTLRVTKPRVGVLLIRNRPDYQTANLAMQAGIREVIAADDISAFMVALRRSLELSSALGADTKTNKRRGKVILVFSAKGGCGKTTVSTNLARALSENTANQVAIVDFDLQFGDVAVALQLEPHKTISQAVRMAANLDSAGLMSLMTETNRPNLKALLAPVDPSEVDFISPQLAEQLLLLLRANFDYVVIDSPPAFSEVILKTFELADEVVLITTLDLPSVKNLKVAIESLGQLGLSSSKAHVVINRSTLNAGIDRNDVRNAIGHAVSAEIPNSDIVPIMVNRGKTVIDGDRRHAVSKAFFEVANLVSSQTAATTALRKRHWFGRQSA